MVEILSDLRNNHERIQRVILFILTGIIVVLLLPKEGKFKYEYQKGRPWGHEDLVAPFDFAIEKPRDELSNEIAEVKNQVRVYVKRDEEASTRVLNNFRNNLAAALNTDSSKTISLKKLERNLLVGNRALSQIYSIGILQSSEEINGLKKGQLVFLKEGNTATQVDLSSFYSVQTAYAFIQEYLENEVRIDKEELLSALSESLVQNIVYDAATTERLLKEDLNAVSETRGMIPQGLMVISRGDMVDSEKFQILESLRKEYQSRLGSSESSYLILIGQLIMVFIVLIMFWLFLEKYRSDLMQNNWQVTFLLMLILGMVAIATLAQSRWRLHAT